MKQAKNTVKAPNNTAANFQKKTISVAVGGAMLVLCASAQAATYASGVNVERIYHGVINFATNYTDIFGQIDVVVAGNGAAGSSGSSASSAANGTSGTTGTVGTSAASVAGTRTISRIHTPEQTVNSALVSVNTISNSLAINGILLDAKVAPDANTANSTLTISASTSATGGIGGVGGAGGAGASGQNTVGGTGGTGGAGGSATGGNVLVSGDLQRNYTANATVSDNNATNATAGVITTSSGSRAGIGLQSVNDITMIVTTKSTASTYAQGGQGGSGGVGGPGGSVTDSGGNYSDGGAGGTGGVGGAATAGNATADVDSRATISLTSSVSSNTVANEGRITSALDGIGLQALSIGDGRAYATAIATSDAVSGSSGAVGTAGNAGTGGQGQNGGGGAGAAGAGGSATLGATVATADARASVTTVARLLDNGVTNSGIVLATAGTGVNLLADAQSRASTSSLAVRSLNGTDTEAAGTYLGTHSTLSAFNVLTGSANASLLRNTVANSGQITAPISGIAVIGSALSTIFTNNASASSLASDYVTSSADYQAANGTSYAVSSVQSNQVSNSGTISSNAIGVNIYADTDSLVNAGTSSSNYDTVRGSSQAISDATSNSILNTGTVYVGLPTTGTVGYGLSVRSSAINITNIGGVNDAQQATALVSSNTINNQNDIFVVSNSINETGTTLVGILAAADATNTGRSKITGTGDTAATLGGWAITGTTATPTATIPPSLNDLNTSARVNSNTVLNTDLISLNPLIVTNNVPGVSRSNVTSSAILLSATATSNPNVYLDSTLSSPGRNTMSTEGVRTTVDQNTVSSTGSILARGLNVYGVRLLSSATMNTPNNGDLDLSISSASASTNSVTTGGTISLTATGTNSLASGVQIESQSSTNFGNSSRAGAGDDVRQVYAASDSSSNTITNSAALTSTAATTASGLIISANTSVNFGTVDQTTDDLVVTSVAQGNTINQTSSGSAVVTGSTVYGAVISSNASVIGAANLRAANVSSGAALDVRSVTANTNQNTISIGGTLTLNGAAAQGGIGLFATASNNITDDTAIAGSGGIVQAYVGRDSVTGSGNTVTNSSTLTVSNGHGVWLKAEATESVSVNPVNAATTAEVSRNTITNTGAVSVAGAGNDAIRLEAIATDTANTQIVRNSITNSGSITSAASNAVEMIASTITNNTIENSGTLTSLDHAIVIDAAVSASNNSITNTGTVSATAATSDFVNIVGASTAASNVINNAGLVVAGNYGVYIQATTTDANAITNSGSSYTLDNFVNLEGTTVTNNSVTNSGLAVTDSMGIRLAGSSTLTGNTVINSGRLVTSGNGIDLTGTTTRNNTVTLSGALITDYDLTLVGSALTRSDLAAWDYTDIGNAVVIGGTAGAGNFNILNISAPAYLAGHIQLASVSNVKVNLNSGLSHSNRWAIKTTGFNYVDQESAYNWINSAGEDQTTTRASLTGVVPWFVAQGVTDTRIPSGTYGGTFDVYATIDPTAFNAAVNQAGDLSGSVSGMMSQGMVDNKERTHSLWLGASGQRLDYKGDRLAINDHETSLGSYGLGYAYRYNPDWLIGAMIGSTDSSLKVSSLYSDLYANSYNNKARGEFLSLNVGTNLEGFDVNLGLSGGTQRHEDRRFVNDNLEWWGVSYATSKYTSKWLAPEITVAYPWTIETGLVLKPNVNVRYTNQKINGYTETGSSSNATVEGRTLGITDTTVGFDLTKTYGQSSITGRVAYISRSSDEQDVARVTMIGDTNNVPTFYDKFGAVRAGFSWKLNLASDLDFYVNANYLSGSDVKGADGNVALRLKF